ncbi:uncharacterized protein LOC126672832 [Mercurialis annua]|uniref:uncharacterized protein LOC126672832 n=1 Tax=Mercurialis annua TaxID=3986 RepID=UPI0021600B3E|nr:uncharacterized protein LOC126672832 [Mercurialis annua]
MQKLLGRKRNMSLPHELVVEIFLRLPLDSLMRCRSICKEWDFMITNDAEILLRCDKELPTQLKNWLENESRADHSYIYDDICPKLRKNTAALIAQNSKNDKFDAYVRYLAMNVFDRFISRGNRLRISEKKDVSYRVRALAISCMSIAFKAEKYNSCRKKMSMDQNIDKKICKRDIYKVKRLILKRIGKPKDYDNPLSYVSIFLWLAKIPETSFKINVIRLIIQSQGVQTSTIFKPSIIAASAIVLNIKAVSIEKYNECMEMFTVKYFQMRRINIERCEFVILYCCTRLFIPVVFPEEFIVPSKEEVWSLRHGRAANFKLKWKSDEDDEDLSLNDEDFPPTRSEVRAFPKKYNWDGCLNFLRAKCIPYFYRFNSVQPGSIADFGYFTVLNQTISRFLV